MALAKGELGPVEEERLRQIEASGRVASVVTAELYPDEFNSIASDVGITRDQLLDHVKMRPSRVDYNTGREFVRISDSPRRVCIRTAKYKKR